MSLERVEVVDMLAGDSPAVVVIDHSSGPSVVEVDGGNQPSIVEINQGPSGNLSTAPISTITETALVGYIYGNGTNVDGATQATHLADANTLVSRDSSGESYFQSVIAEQSFNLSYNTTITTDATTGQGVVFPDASGYVALTSNATGSASNIEIYAKAATTLAKGAVVYVSGASGANKLISPAQASTEALSSKTIGVTIQALATNAFGYVMTEGDLVGLGISLGHGHGVVEGDPIWLSPTTPGGMVFGVANKPSAPDHMVFIGYVTRINGNTLDSIYVKIQNGFELQELHNVAINGLTDGQILAYESSTGLWKNKPSAITKSTTGNPATGIEGQICINTFDNNVKIYADGGWREIASW